ncbi:MMPL family transporter [Candidatus Saccharibacteria bacterium]|nr:MMPL family transporter [Candidatus Saccharibacteria bacterium]
MKVPNFIVKHRVAILLTSVLLLIPAIFGIIKTRVNYDMLTYLPKDMDTMVGQEELKTEFKKGAFSLIIFENLDEKQIAGFKEKIENIPHVASAIWYSSLSSNLAIPMEILPDDIYTAFNSDHATMMAVFYDTGTSEDETLNAVTEIRKTTNTQAFVSGMSALVVDLKDLCEREEIIYVAIAVILAILAMLIFLDNWLIPFVFIASIGIMILLNLGTNIIFGEISFITKALSAVLQLAVTMDYSIFLWHSYQEEKSKEKNTEKAMATAISKTFTSVLGSSITTIAGFIALCFMSFAMGRDLGLVMAKGVVLGVIGCVTVLPAIILLLDKILNKASHRPLIGNTDKLSKRILKIFPIILTIFTILIVPSFITYKKASSEVYYDMGGSLPKDMPVVIANSKLEDEFHMSSTHMILVESKIGEDNIRKMAKEMEKVEGVKFVLGLETLIGERIPIEALPDSATSILKTNKWDLILVGSEYDIASDKVNEQIEKLSTILKNYDESGLLIGEAPAMKDMIETTDTDFKVVNAISIIAIFIIIALVEKSFILPFILIAIIEVAIFINLGISHLTGTSLPFIAPICISTIQLGATVDYAILMTTRYKAERISGKNKKEAVSIALKTSIPSIIVSGAGLFVATLGVAIYSNIDMISSICMLLSRGAIISVVMVILVLPAMFMLCDKLICKTTKEMKSCLKN